MDDATRREIDRIASKVLKEGRLVEPPIRIENVLEHLSVHRKFYDLQDPNLLQRFAHKLRIGSQRIVGIVRKVRLAAIWTPDQDEILIDESQPAPKQLWASFHDATHRALPWHREFFLGDTAQTLEPYYQERPGGRGELWGISLDVWPTLHGRGEGSAFRLEGS